MNKILELEHRLLMIKCQVMQNLCKTWKVKVADKGDQWFKVKDVVDTKKPWPHPEAGNMYHLHGIDQPVHQSKITDIDEDDD
jgi:hypothetical protein